MVSHSGTAFVKLLVLILDELPKSISSTPFSLESSRTSPLMRDPLYMTPMHASRVSPALAKYQCQSMMPLTMQFVSCGHID